MGDGTGIEWTDATWNPIVGCSVVSPGCTNCYAMKQAARIEAMTIGENANRMESGSSRLAKIVTPYAGTTMSTKAGAVWTGKVALAREETLSAPLRWKRPRKIFVNSMGDLFHESVPDEWIDRVFAVMALAPQHAFQVLTKRSGRMRAYFDARRVGDPWAEAADAMADMIGMKEHPIVLEPRDLPLPNVWLGVSAEDQRRADERVPGLLATPAAVRFVSAEPLLGPIDFRRWFYVGAEGGIEYAYSRSNMLRWIIVGAESGHGARPMEQEWAQDIVDQCADASVECFVKQLSGPNGRAVKDMNGFPPRLRVRQYPRAA